MRTILLVFTLYSLLLTPNSYAQDDKNWGVGLRFGDPTGITLKKYSGSSAFEIVVGRSHLWGHGWYDKSFDNWYKNKNFNYSTYAYYGYTRTAPLSVQFHFLKHRPITFKNEDKGGSLEWYYGLGGQIRWQTITYHYKYTLVGDPLIYDAKDRYTDLDLGIDAVLGLEYTLKASPISIFLEGGIFMEIYDYPFYPWGQTGLGARYNF